MTHHSRFILSTESLKIKFWLPMILICWWDHFSQMYKLNSNDRFLKSFFVEMLTKVRICTKTYAKFNFRDQCEFTIQMSKSCKWYSTAVYMKVWYSGQCSTIFVLNKKRNTFITFWAFYSQCCLHKKLFWFD